MMRCLTSVQNPLVKHLVKLRKNQKYRTQCQSVVIEGSKLIQEVCQKKPVKIILAVNEKHIPKGVCADESYTVSDAISKKVSGVLTPEGLIAEVAMPEQSSLQEAQYVIAFDGVADPGNLGTLLRTALALGWEGVFIVEGSCDPFNDKALRAAKGATFRLPYRVGSWDELKQLIDVNQLNAFAADIDGDDLSGLEIKERVLLVLGSEAHGLSSDTKKVCKKVTIPMSGEMESLNVSVAGGILMYTIKVRGQSPRKLGD